MGILRILKKLMKNPDRLGYLKGIESSILLIVRFFFPPIDSSIGCKLCFMKQKSLVRISFPLPLCKHVQKKKKNHEFKTLGDNVKTNECSRRFPKVSLIIYICSDSDVAKQYYSFL
jgi:hypothetical protein